MKTVTHVSTLFYYDGPQVFEARDADGVTYIGVMIPPSDVGEERSLVVAVTPERLREFRGGCLDLRSLVLEAGRDGWYLATGCPDRGELLDIASQSTPLAEEVTLVPDKGFFLPSTPAHAMPEGAGTKPALLIARPSVSPSADTRREDAVRLVATTRDRFDKLVTLLKELFQLDKPELDFGFYRIMHAKAADVTRFLEHDLLPQVREAFSEYQSSDRREIERQLADAKANAVALGVPPASVPKVRELERRSKETALDLDALEADVYDHTYRFFRRYFREGDFFSNQVHKDGVYAIPYQGEEVKLHWANADQYYTKTSEYLRNYSFRLRPDNERNPMRTHFRLVDAAEGEHGNVKPAERHHFTLANEDPILTEDGPDGEELVIRFEYRPPSMADWPTEQRPGKKTPPKQVHLLDEAESRLLAGALVDFPEWAVRLAQRHVKPDGSEADYSRLRAHLNRYSARNTFDYFIHKDLGGFLRRELDFYLKNEVMRLDDIERADAIRVEQYLSKLKVIRRIAGKIITFLAQLEDFQKTLWLKKKFVTESSWCIRVACVPADFLPEIAGNDAQRAEWVDLCGIDTIEGDLATVGYTDPLTPEFIRQHPTLMVDTRHFPDSWVARLLATFDDIDEITDGLLVHSENLQALNWMKARYKENIDCIYVDPPYNTSENTFVYKNAYKHSSWATMIRDRLTLARSLLSEDGVLQCAIDDTETWRLRAILDEIFNPDNRVSTIVSQVNPAGQNLRPNTPALSHDYCHIYALDIDSMTMATRKLTAKEKRAYQFDDDKGRYLWDNLRRRGGNSRPSDRPGQWFPLYVDEERKMVSLERFDGALEVWPIDPKGERRIWRSNPSGTRRDIERGEIGVVEKAGRIEIVKKSRMPKGKKPKTLWPESRYSATTHGTKLLNDVIGQQLFSYPKSIHLVTDCLRYWSGPTTTVLDFFAGSGTTGHAVVTLNREDAGSRKVILVEVGGYFDTVLVPRMKKITYAPKWKDGKPAEWADANDAERSPRMLKVIRLESYEDTLNNLELQRVDDVGELERELGSEAKWQSEYMLQYMLDVEARSGGSLLRLGDFKDPSQYSMRIGRSGHEEMVPVKVDIVETFNWLIGVKVRRVRGPWHCHGTLLRDEEGRVRPEERSVTAEGGAWWFRTIEGTLPDGRNALIVWRNRPGGDDPDGIEKDNAILGAWFQETGYTDPNRTFDVVYVNGDQNLESLKPEDATWTTRMIEADFRWLMFDTEEV